MKKIYFSIVCAIIASMLFSLNACADEESNSGSKSISIKNDMASMETIIGNLKSAGFSSIRNINYHNGSYEVNGIANGMYTNAYVQPHTGNVIREKNYANLKEIDSIQKLVKTLQKKYYHILYSIKLNVDQTAYEVTARNPEGNKVSLTVSSSGEITSY